MTNNDNITLLENLDHEKQITELEQEIELKRQELNQLIRALVLPMLLCLSLLFLLWFALPH